MLALAGLLRPASGSVSAHDIAERTIAECVHLVGHRDGLKGALTSAENLRFSATLLGGDPDSAQAALERVGLPHVAAIPVSYLSAGQRRRVALARLLVAHRPLWLLDEPTTALDSAAQATLEGLIDHHLALGGLLVAASHTQLDVACARELRLGAS